MSIWEDFRFHRLIQVPRVEQRDREQDPARHNPAGPLAAALTGAHASLLGESGPAALLAAWIRSSDGRLHFLLGGRPFFPPAGAEPVSGTHPVLFPPGAVATALSAHDVFWLLDPFSWWVPCAGRPDALWAPSPGKQEKPAIRRGSFDQHVAHVRDPFAWMIVAEPLTSQAVQPELDLLVNEILPLSRGEVGEAKRIALERKQARHRELSRAQVGGAWRIRVVVGAMKERAATTVAATLCAASELDGLPYVVAPAGPAMSLANAIRADTQDQNGNRAPIAAGTELLVALTRPPERELPGLRLVEPHTFDVTPEHQGGAGLPLGDVLDDADAMVGELTLSRDSLNRHTFVCGATGAGKSHTVQHLLTEASRVGLPWLVVEPAKAEYSALAARLAPLGQDVIVIRPGDPKRPPAGFNPLEPAPDFPLQTHVDLLRALFLAAFEPHEPFPQVLATALTRSYEELGWDLALGKPVHTGPVPRYPTLGDLQRVATAVVSGIGYGKEVAADVHGFINVRLSSLRLGTTGRFFEGGHKLDFDKLLGRNVIFEIEDVGDDADKSFLMGAILLRLTEQLRGHPSRELRHLTVIEEAHRLLRRAEPGAGGATTHAVEMFAALLAEVRAYGEGLIVAEQIPSKLIPDVIKNTAIKIVHRLPAKDDRDSVGATMNLDDRQSRQVVSLDLGESAVFTVGMDRPLLVKVRKGPDPADLPDVPLGSIDGVIARRSRTCGPACVAEPCRLRHMREAQHLLTRHPWLALWAELLVVAHLTGMPTPLIDDDQRTLLGPVAARELDCALSHAVDDAVAVRAALLDPQVDPDELAAHCVALLRDNLNGTVPGCAHGAFDYAATHYRWRGMLAELEHDPDDPGPHPDTARWQRRYSRRIPGATRAEQIEAVAAWYEAALNDRTSMDAVTFGTRRPSVIERVIGGTPDQADGWDATVVDAVALFGFNWPSWLLIPFSRHPET